MKKIVSILASIFLASAAFAEWQITFAGGQFFDKLGNPIAEAKNFAVIVDMNGKGFGSFEALDGDSFSRGSYVNASNDFMTLVTGQLSDPDSEGYYLAYSNSSWKFNNADYGFSGDEEAALLVWDSPSMTLSAGDSYVLVTPSLAGGDLSGGNPWIVPASDTYPWEWYFLTESVDGDIADTFGYLANTVAAVPEPAAFAAIFGALALALAYRRRK